MNQVSVLREALRPHLPWHGARLSFLAMFLIALIRVRTVNWAELATGFCGYAHPDSHYKRLQRFFRHYDVHQSAIAQTIVRLLAIPEPWILSVDRTEWQFGDTIFNILVLGVVHEGVALPLVWTLLDKRGNSNTGERIQLFREFLNTFPEVSVAYLTADREFVGHDWFGYLKDAATTPFRIRIRENHCLFDGGRTLKVRTVFADLAVNQTKVLRHKRRLWNHWLYVAGLRLDDGNLLVIATQVKPKSAIGDYAQRWGIETLFGLLKTRGFCLEATHLRDSERLSKLFALLALAVAWALSSGLWLHEQRPIRLKSHHRRAKSLFRYGLDHLRSVLLNLDHRFDDFLQVIQLLSCT